MALVPVAMPDMNGPLMTATFPVSLSRSSGPQIRPPKPRAQRERNTDNLPGTGRQTLDEEGMDGDVRPNSGAEAPPVQKAKERSHKEDE